MIVNSLSKKREGAFRGVEVFMKYHILFYTNSHRG